MSPGPCSFRLAGGKWEDEGEATSRQAGEGEARAWESWPVVVSLAGESVAAGEGPAALVGAVVWRWWWGKGGVESC